MNFPKLDIKVHSAQMQINVEKPRINISGQRGEFNIQKREHHFSIASKPAEISINNYPAYKQLGYKNVSDLGRDIASKSIREGMRAIADMSSDGDNLMKIETQNRDAIAQVALSKHRSRYRKAEIGIMHFPQENIQINVQEGEVKVNYSPGEINVRSEKTLRIDAEMGRVETRATYPKVDVRVVGAMMDIRG